MNDADLDNSPVVTALTWVLYLAWLAPLAGIALYLGVEPLPSIQAQFPGWTGTFAALGVGMAFILVSRQIYDALRARYRRSTEPEQAAPSSEEPPAKNHKKRKKKKQKKKHQRR